MSTLATATSSSAVTATQGIILNGHLIPGAVGFLPAHSASFAYSFVSGMQSFYFSESQDAMELQTCHEK